MSVSHYDAAKYIFYIYFQKYPNQFVRLFHYYAAEFILTSVHISFVILYHYGAAKYILTSAHISFVSVSHYDAAKYILTSAHISSVRDCSIMMLLNIYFNDTKLLI